MMNDRYQVLIVEHADDELRATTIRQTPFETSDASAAKFWADAFNERELAEPIGAWAIVRPCPDR